MAYQALYRKWRPIVFEDVVGQEHITRTLQNQIETGKISHAYLFCGTRGTGKTTAAKIFSRAVNCLNPKNGSPCNECRVCKGILDGSIMDVYEIDAASNNGVDNIREIIDDAKYVATEAQYRVYIIDEVHMLSGGAFNALLKTLEEPPEHVIFILATTEAHKVPQTILSRCQRFDFKRIRPDDIIRRMREIAMGDGLSITDDAYRLLAQLADGSMRDGLSILERCVASAGTSLTYESITSALGIAGNGSLFEMTDCINSHNSQGILEIISRLMNDGKDLHVFIDNLIEHYRNLLVCKVTDNPAVLLNRDDEEIIKLKAQAEKTSFEKLSNAAAALSKARSEAKWVKEPRIIYELALIKLTKPELDASPDALLDRVAECEEKLKNGVTVKAAPPEPAPEKKHEVTKRQPSARLFVPIDISALTAESPVVAAARRWDKTAQSIAKKYPHIAAAVLGRQVTIDGEGLILIYQKNEMMLKKIAVTFSKQITETVQQASGTDLVVKTAFFDDIEESIIDFWKIGSAEKPAEEDKSDPIDRLERAFPEIVEITDESEFIGYNPADDNFTQSELGDNSDDEENEEEFLSDDERESE
ncbi:MAG: DNA polymerase III subunit gamma/tau [Clostridiales bacterium]|nr:DNA polymerase III subunit gamma/tau [Clostridiales bacterium]